MAVRGVYLSTMDANQLQDARDQLLELRHELELGLSTRSAADDSITPDNAIGRLTRMEAIQAQSISSAGKERARKRLKQVKVALERVEDGSYGTCATCDDEIAPGRLEIMPETRLCTKCAARNR